LLKEGATLVTSAQDVLEALNLKMVVAHSEARAVIPEDETEAALLTLLSAEPVHVDQIVHASGLPIAQVSSTLAMMELKGMVRQVAGMQYVLARESRADYIVD
jgi:DNA processing protein